MKATERLSRALSTSTRSQASQGGLDRAAVQVVSEQLTVTGPTRRTSGQLPPSASSPEEQSDTETEREEANSGTYNLEHT